MSNACQAYHSPQLVPTQSSTLSVSHLTVRGIIRAARGNRSQSEYAKDLGITQDRLSKYERGRTNPPAEIIERCMRDAFRQSAQLSPEADAVARKVERHLAGEEHSRIRQALDVLIDCLTATDRSRGRTRQRLR